ncbi:MAG: site-2 protease family protein [Cytophagales bacterium]|nr:MAG: site-2 protease family protein [Cytophagales bacterium]
MRKYLIHLLLFVITLITNTIAGAEWMFGRSFLPAEWFTDDPEVLKEIIPMGWPEFWAGFKYSGPFLAILTVHEFGHYFTAKANKVRVTLPYYIPMWFGGSSVGTLGAFIKIQDYINSRRKYFDIGIAGPLAGFVLALIVVWYGFTHLPDPRFIFDIHPEYAQYGLDYGKYVYKNMPEGSALALGDNLLFWFFKTYVADPALLPHPYEMIHYPYLLAGYLALFFTSLNLIPIGQLDGGHVLYALIGRDRFRWVAPVLFTGFVFYAGLGWFTVAEFATDGEEFYQKLLNLGLYVFFLSICFSRISEENRTLPWLMALSVVTAQLVLSWAFPTIQGYPGFFAFIFLLGRFLGVYHPETELQEPLDTKRKVLGWLALFIFVISFSPKPFIF